MMNWKRVVLVRVCFLDSEADEKLYEDEVNVALIDTDLICGQQM